MTSETKTNNQKLKKMKIEKQKFRIFFMTEFGLGMLEKKAISFSDAFSKLSKKDKMKDGWIESENDESFTFNQILKIEETI